jgi:hypothetical protein
MPFSWNHSFVPGTNLYKCTESSQSMRHTSYAVYSNDYMTGSPANYQTNFTLGTSHIPNNDRVERCLLPSNHTHHGRDTSPSTLSWSTIYNEDWARDEEMYQCVVTNKETRANQVWSSMRGSVWPLSHRTALCQPHTITACLLYYCPLIFNSRMPTFQCSPINSSKQWWTGRKCNQN